MDEAHVPLLLMRHGRPLRGVMVDRQPWVCARDFGLLMGHRHPERICRLMDDDQLMTLDFLLPNAELEPVQVISESGLYRALCRFTHPENRNLRRWLSQEALPALRDSQEGHEWAPRRTLMAWSRQHISLLEWQGELWIPFSEIPCFGRASAPGRGSLRTLLKRWLR